MDPRQEVASLDALHREKPAVLLREQLVELHHVRVADVGERAKLALEAEEGRGIQVRHRLERDDLAALEVTHLVYDPHAPFAETTLDDEATGAVKSVDRSEHGSHGGPMAAPGTPPNDTRSSSLSPAARREGRGAMRGSVEHAALDAHRQQALAPAQEAELHDEGIADHVAALRVHQLR